MEKIQIDSYRWQVPKTGNMLVPAIIYSDKQMLEEPNQEEAVLQAVNVACLPGILKASFAMPDMHLGYGFPIGGVAAFDIDSGVISPGGVGYDINCGVRLASTSLKIDDIKQKLPSIADALYREIPTGVGSTGYVKLTEKELKKVLATGSLWAIEKGFGESYDIEHTEEKGCMQDAGPDIVSKRALERGKNQLGTLGSGNHFLEIGYVDKIYDEHTAKIFGLCKDQVTIMLHSGSRGLGHQVCDDFLALMKKEAFCNNLPDRQLAYAPIKSNLGKSYYSAMSCAANYAWANRQILMSLAKKVIEKTLSIEPASFNMSLLYDVCHNIAKYEVHKIENRSDKVCVLRKGATRAFGPGHPDIPERYRAAGQPVIIPGDMGTASYVLAGTQKAMEETFGSTSHGAGRLLSRQAAKKKSKGRAIYRELEDKGIFVRWASKSTLAEEMPEAYKDISKVADIIDGAGISKKVARLRPLAVIKG